MNHKINYPIVATIKDIVDESYDVKTFILDKEINALPRQFVMVWVPGIDEKPFAIAQTGKYLGFSVKRRGKATQAMHAMKKGDSLGVRGPYGDGVFDLSGKKKIILLGHGSGTLGLRLLLEEATKKKIKVDVILGANTGKNVLFVDKFKSLGANVTIATDDGSAGTKDIKLALEDKLKYERYDGIYTCGPERIMLFICQIGLKYDVEVQASLERWIKCGFGLCGQCAIDPSGLRICKEGPVFKTDILKEIDGFGFFTRDKSGEKVKWKYMH